MKLNFNYRNTILISILSLSGCATSPKIGNVIPSEGGIYQAVSTGESRDSALESALYTAEKTCKARKMQHIVLDQKIEYKGILTEDSNKNLDKAQEIIVAATGKWLPTLSSEDDYKINMRFKCEL